MSAAAMVMRPHHILCTRAFKGNGYSAEFARHMHDVIGQLDNSTDIELACGLDVICSGCPNNRGTSCSSEQKVRQLDADTLEYLGLCEGTYSYADIKRIVEIRLTEEVYEKICGSCEWKAEKICSYEDVMNGCRRS